MKKIAILGAGAIGSIMGGYLTRGGEDVTLICTSWREHADALKKNGLVIRGKTGDQRIAVKSIFIDEMPQLKDKFDVVFIAVKSNDTEKVLKAIKPYLSADAWVLSAQNGINEDVIISIVGEQNTIGCSVRTGGTLAEPGVVMEGGTEGVGFLVGELDGKITPRVQEIVRITGLCRKTEIIPDIWLERWNKLVTVSMSGPVNVISGMNSRQAFASEKAHRIFARILLEGVAVAGALGHRIDKVAGIDTEIWKKLAKGPLPEIDQMLAERGKMFGDAPGGASLDILRGRPTETEYTNGYIVKKGKELGIPTPVNEMLVKLVKSVERGELKPSQEMLDEVIQQTT